MENLTTYDKIKELILNEIPFQIIEKNKGIYEFGVEGSFSLGISFEDLKYFEELTLENVYIFNLFYGEEYINIPGAYRMDGEKFICIDGIKKEVGDNFVYTEEICDLDVFEEITNAWNDLLD